MCFESNESLHQRVVYGLQIFEHRVGERVLARHLSQMLDRIQLKAVGWQKLLAHILWHIQVTRDVPTRLIHDHDDELDDMASRHLCQEHRHCLSVSPGRLQRVHHAIVRANGSEGVQVLALQACADDGA